MRVINDKGDQVGVVPIQEALSIAREGDLDLVEVAPQADPPVCRIMDYGRYKYKLRKKQQQARSKSHGAQVKEIRLHPKIDEHDVAYRIEHARQFIAQGNRVQVNVLFKGRELAHIDLGRELLVKFAEAVEDVAKVERNPKMEGRKMDMLLIPK